VRSSDGAGNSADSSQDRLVLTGEGLAWLAGVMLLGAIGWWKNTNLVLLLVYMMAALLVINGVLAWANVRRVGVSCKPVPPAYGGESARLTITVSNTSTRTATVVLEDQTGVASTSWLVHQLQGGASIDCSAERQFQRRGRFPCRVLVSSGFPLGLLRQTRSIATGTDLIVLPAAGYADADRMRQWFLRQAGGDSRARKVLRRVTAEHSEVRGVRPYRNGDAIRSIHWRSSARRGELMVREYDAAPNPDLVIIVEPWLPKIQTAEQRDNLEATLSLAVTIARTWSQIYGSRITIGVAGDPDSIVTTTAADLSVRQALIPLASVEGAPTFEVLRPEHFERTLQRTARVVVSSRTNSPYAAALSQSTGQPFLALSPVDQPMWYQPPPHAAS
jgi:uncharacterized protein (DUF58 family)